MNGLLLGVIMAATPTASTGTVKIVRFFLGSQVADLPPERIPDFLAVDHMSLPAKLRDRYQAKKAQLLALKKNVDGRKKPPIRRLGMERLESPSCADYLHMDPKLLPQFGFWELYEPEVAWLAQETRCSQCELIAEFSLTIAAKDPPPESNATPRLRYFLSVADPLTALVQARRRGRNAFGTNFFGSGRPVCR